MSQDFKPVELGVAFDDTLDSKGDVLNRLMEIFDASSEGLWEMSPDNQVNFYNTNFYQNFDVNLNGSHLDEWLALIHPDDTSRFSNNVTQQVSEVLKRFKSQYRVRNKQGDYIWIEATGVLKLDSDGQILYMLGSHKDITEEKNYQRRIYNVAYIDQLTGLFNRAKLVERLRDKITNNAEGAFIYFNINDFSLYNDTFGYHSGNELLLLVADSLNNVFHDNCEIFRVNADEFAVLIQGKASQSKIAHDIDLLLEMFRQALNSLHDNYTHSMGVGVCMLPSEEACEEALIYQAKLTMRYAKEHAHRKYAFYDKKYQSEVQRRLYIETGMKAAIRNKEFFIKYQPILSSKTGELESFEALVRWKSKTYGEIMPDEFIPVAEKNRNIVELGYFVLASACAFISSYNQKHNKDLKVSINVSVLQLLQRKFTERVAKTVQAFNLKPHNVVIEVTESLLLDSNAYAKGQIEFLRNTGFSVSLDDFGAGYSSLNSFFSVPFTQLKIDRQVVSKAMDSMEVAAYISFLTALCKEKGIEVVGEGIESEEMAKKTTNMGVGLLQGYFYSRPVSEQEAYQLE